MSIQAMAPMAIIAGAFTALSYGSRAIIDWHYGGVRARR